MDHSSESSLEYSSGSTSQQNESSEISSSSTSTESDTNSPTINPDSSTHHQDGFDEVLQNFAEAMEREHLQRSRLLFEPLFYTAEHADLKFKKMCVRAHENELKLGLERDGVDAESASRLARMMSYYPGLGASNHQTFVPASPYRDEPMEWPPLEDEDWQGDKENYLFRDLPAD